MFSQRTCRNALLITLFITAIVGVAILGGCGTTRQTDLWADPSYNAAPMKKILVIAIRKDQLKRRMWEDAIVNEISARVGSGTNAVASYQHFPDDVPDTTAVRAFISEESFDGVLVVAGIIRDSLTTEVPGYTSSESVTRYSERWNAYVIRYEDVYHPGYSETETTLSVRTDLLVPRQNGKLVWSVTSQSVDPSSADQFRNSVAGRVAGLLKKERLIH
jgi:hypothetical protein